MKNVYLLILVFAFVGAMAQKDSIRLGLPLTHTEVINYAEFSPVLTIQ